MRTFLIIFLFSLWSTCCLGMTNPSERGREFENSAQYKQQTGESLSHNSLKFTSFRAVSGTKNEPIHTVQQLSQKSLFDKSVYREDAVNSYYLRKGREVEGPFAGVTCFVCELAVGRLQALIKNVTEYEMFLEEAIKICTLFKIEDGRVCRMIVHEFQEELQFVLTNLVLSPAEACGIVLGSKCSTPYYPGRMWNVTLPPTPKPEPAPPKPPKAHSPTVKFVQITDIHIDFQYRTGSAVECKAPLCCRGEFPGGRYTSEKAGLYGSYRKCDSPISTVVSLFKHLSTIQDQFDYVIFTGDIPAHDIWNQTRKDQLEHLHTLTLLFHIYLPDKPVYFCVGNHESAPLNSFPPPWVPNKSMGWLYGALTEAYIKWLPPSALETVLNCGSYSHSPFPGFRIISVNGNYGHSGNWWLLLNETDPCDQLQWLTKELQKAENVGEKVHILTHMPPGDRSTLKAWSWNYYKIINRYENTIVNQFYGHSHKDWFELFYDDVTFQRPVGVGFVAPSVTPYADLGLNPTYRIYTMDGNYNGSSWAVLDYHNYYMNLTDANLSGKTSWKLSYSPKQAYNMTSLYASDWSDLVQRMETDDALFQQFYRNYYSLHPTSPCEDQCKGHLLCDLKEGRSHDPDLCQTQK